MAFFVPLLRKLIRFSLYKIGTASQGMGVSMNHLLGIIISVTRDCHGSCRERGIALDRKSALCCSHVLSWEWVQCSITIYQKVELECVNSGTQSCLETKTDGKTDLLQNSIDGLHCNGSMSTYLPLRLNCLCLSQNCQLTFSFSRLTFALCLYALNTFLYAYIVVIQ